MIVVLTVCLSYFVISVFIGLQTPIYLEVLGFAEENGRLVVISFYKG